MSTTAPTTSQELVARSAAAVAAKPCAGGCGLGREPGDIYCQGCREGHEANRPANRYEGW